MARRTMATGSEDARPDMTPMIDITFLLITFFVMLSTIAKDELAQRINLPVAETAALLEDDRIPDSLNLNVDSRQYLLGWGLEINLNVESGWETARKLIFNEAAIQKGTQGPSWRETGLTTTLILRVDRAADYGTFRRLMDLCREAGFSKFQLKAREEDAPHG